MPDDAGLFDSSLTERSSASIKRFLGRDPFELLALLLLAAPAIRILLSVIGGVIANVNGDDFGGTSVAFRIQSFCQFADLTGFVLTILLIAYVWWRITTTSVEIPEDAGSLPVEDTEAVFRRVWYWRLFARTSVVLSVLGAVGSVGTTYFYIAEVGESQQPTSFVIAPIGLVAVLTLVWLSAVMAAWRLHRYCEETLANFIPVVDTTAVEAPA